MLITKEQFSILLDSMPEQFDTEELNGKIITFSKMREKDYTIWQKEHF